MSAATLAIKHIEEAHDLLTVYLRREEHMHGAQLPEAALRAIDRAEAVVRRMLDEACEEWQR